MATAEDSDSPVAMKLKKMWLKTPVSEEQAAQAVLDPAIGNYSLLFDCKYSCNMVLLEFMCMMARRNDIKKNYDYSFAAQYSLLLHLLFILQFMFELNFCCCCFRVPLGGNC